MDGTSTPSVWLPSDLSLPKDKRMLIYFVCGNPGLIEYYHSFLSNLRGLLDKADYHTTYDIYGRSLPGFSDGDHQPFTTENPPHGLETVVRMMHEDVKNQGRGYDGVVMMGHSVGAWICVEIWHRYLHERKAEVTPEKELKLVHGILLFPTVAHIALSPSGIAFTRLMQYMPLLERHGYLLARMVVGLMPLWFLSWWIQRVVGFESTAANTTIRWLKSKDGIWQTLTLAGDEMATIVSDERRWGEEIWDGEDDGGPRFFMFYGKRDHWVADHVRDEFVERMRSRSGQDQEGDRSSSRRGEKKKMVPKIVIDEQGLKHAFCTKDDSSLDVARRVCEWVADIDEGLRRRRC